MNNTNDQKIPTFRSRIVDVPNQDSKGNYRYTDYRYEVDKRTGEVTDVAYHGDMDQATAELFQKVCSMSIVFGDFFDRTVYDIRVPSLGGNPGQNELRKYGLSFGKINMLIEYELIAPNYNTWYEYKACILDTEKNVANPFQHQGRNWILKPSPERPESNEFRLNGVQLSHVGFQLFHIVEQIPAQQYTKDLKGFFEKQNLQMAEVIIRDRNTGWHIVQR